MQIVTSMGRVLHEQPGDFPGADLRGLKLGGPNSTSQILLARTFPALSSPRRALTTPICPARVLMTLLCRALCRAFTLWTPC